MIKELTRGFVKGAHHTWRYGYFAPLTAAWIAITRSGNYFWHLRALYRLSFWGGQQICPFQRRRPHG
jgi:hypothetical protein